MTASTDSTATNCADTHKKAWVYWEDVSFSTPVTDNEFTKALTEKGYYRYNQGFYGFGPLEQCDGGRLILAEAAEALYTAQSREIKLLKLQIARRNSDVAIEQSSVAYWRAEHNKLRVSSHKTIRNRSWTATILSLWIIMDATLSYFAGG